MFFVLQDSSSDGTNVELTMEYEPENFLATLAIPVLTLDNALALNVLLPKALQPQNAPLDDFLNLMGTLYGIVGVAHLADCLSDSKLLVAAGASPFYDLPVEGKSLALLWCAVGPLSYVASRTGLGTLGLIVYGAVEVFGSFVVGATSTAGTAATMDPLVNAIIVQGIVAISWVYSFRKQSRHEQQ